METAKKAFRVSVISIQILIKFERYQDHTGKLKGLTTGYSQPFSGFKISPRLPLCSLHINPKTTNHNIANIRKTILSLYSK